MAQKTALQIRSRVQQAEDRLKSAVARLEAAIQGPSRSGSNSDERVVAHETELRDLKLQNAKLRMVKDKVGSSVDKVIDNLKSILEE